MKRAEFVAVLLIVFIAGSTVLAQNTPFRGKVVDDSGAVLIGSTVTLKKGTTVVGTAKTTTQGTFEIQVPPGDYSLQIVPPIEDFETLTQPVHITANMPETTYPMKLAATKTEVTVQENANLISLDPDSNLTATVLDQDLIQQLPDDPDELTAYLTDLAGPRANAAGGVDFIVDGFSNGILPPKDQILQIRINNNPFSTEFTRPGFGRIEIVTKPGTGQYHGSAQFSGRDDKLDANPNLCTFVSCAPKPPYERKFYIANLSGPIIKNKLTAAVNFQHQDNDPSTSIAAFDPFTNAPIGGYLVSPQTFDNYNSRGQWGITSSQRHILNYNLQYQSRNSSDLGVGGIGLVTLPEGSTYDGYNVNNSYSSNNKSEEIQLRETEIISASLIHEFRYEWDHNSSITTPNVLTGPTYTISNSAQFGSSNNYQETRNTNYQLANALSYTGRILTLKTGIQTEHFNQFQDSLAGFNGAYTYANFAAFQANAPSLYTVTTGIPQIQVAEWTIGAFLQTDWKINKKWLVSGGVRYQVQTHIRANNNIDPRGSFSYQLGNSVVIRGGFGIFHQILPVGTVNNLIQYDGQHQLQAVIESPTPAQVALANSGALGTTSEIYTEFPDLRTPYSINSGLSIEKTLKNGLALTAAVDDIKSVHLYRGRDINAPFDTPTCDGIIISGCVRPNPTEGIVNQLESTGDARFDSLTLSTRYRVGRINLFGNYTFSENKTDTRGANALPMDNYDLRADWGYSGQQVRHRIQTSVNYMFPHYFLASLNVNWHTGNPWTQVQNSPGADGSYNQRLPGVPINSMIGAQQLNVGLNLNKTFILREGRTAPQPGQGGPGGGGPPPGFGGGGGRGGGFGGGGRGGNGGVVLGPGGVSMTAFMNTFNILNYTNLSNPVGTLDTPLYGIPTQKVNNFGFSPRIIELGLRVNF